MICNSCGTQNEDIAVFCKNCGTRLQAEQAEAMPKDPQEITAIKKASGSGAVLTAAIAQTISVSLSVLLILAILFFGSFFARLISDFAYEPSSGFYMEPDYSEEQLLSGSSEALLFAVAAIFLFSTISLSVIRLIGLWKIYSASKKPVGMNTSGFAWIKTVAVSRLATRALIILACTAAIYFANNEPTSYPNSPMLDIGYAIAVIIIVFAAIYMVIDIIYNAKIIRDMNAIRDTVKYGEPIRKPSVFVIVILFILGALGCINLTFANIFALPSVITNIALAIALITYRSEISRLASDSHGGYVPPRGAAPAGSAQSAGYKTQNSFTPEEKETPASGEWHGAAQNAQNGQNTQNGQNVSHSCPGCGLVHSDEVCPRCGYRESI